MMVGVSTTTNVCTVLEVYFRFLVLGLSSSICVGRDVKMFMGQFYSELRKSFQRKFKMLNIFLMYKALAAFI